MLRRRSDKINIAFNFVTIADYLGAILSLITTILYAKNNYHAWQISIIAIVLNLYLYTTTGIFAIAALEIIYLSIAIYGLIHWRYGGDKHSVLKISNLPIREGIILVILNIINYFIIYYVLCIYTNSTVAFLDALSMSLSLTAEWLVARKYIENWGLWFLIDCLMLAIFYHKNLSGHIIRNAAYLFIAVYGYVKWRKLKNK